MTRSRTKQSVDTLQQIVTGILSKALVEKDEGPSGVEKDEGPKAKALPRILIFTEDPN